MVHHQPEIYSTRGSCESLGGFYTFIPTKGFVWMHLRICANGPLWHVQWLSSPGRYPVPGYQQLRCSGDRISLDGCDLTASTYILELTTASAPPPPNGGVHPHE